MASARDRQDAWDRQRRANQLEAYLRQVERDAREQQERAQRQR